MSQNNEEKIEEGKEPEVPFDFAEFVSEPEAELLSKEGDSSNESSKEDEGKSIEDPTGGDANTGDPEDSKKAEESKASDEGKEEQKPIENKADEKEGEKKEDDNTGDLNDIESMRAKIIELSTALSNSNKVEKPEEKKPEEKKEEQQESKIEEPASKPDSEFKIALTDEQYDNIVQDKSSFVEFLNNFGKQILSTVPTVMPAQNNESTVQEVTARMEAINAKRDFFVDNPDLSQYVDYVSNTANNLQDKKEYKTYGELFDAVEEEVRKTLGVKKPKEVIKNGEGKPAFIKQASGAREGKGSKPSQMSLDIDELMSED